MNVDIKDNNIEWNPQVETIERIIAEPFVQKYMEFLIYKPWRHGFIIKKSMSSEFKLKEGSWFFLW